MKETNKIRLPKEIKNKKISIAFFADLDGSTKINKEFEQTLKLIKENQGMFIQVTGRTIGDVLDNYKNKQIMEEYWPELIVGDNGATIYDTKNKEFLRRLTFPKQTLEKIINAYTNITITKPREEIEKNIRFTDGEKILAKDTKEIKEYYKRQIGVVNFSKNIFKDLEEKSNNNQITKTTFSGTKQEMEELSNKIKEYGCWADIGETQFLKEKNEKYRLDVAFKKVNKGEAEKILVEELKPTMVVCVGNAENDVSMFEETLKYGGIAGIVKGGKNENEAQKSNELIKRIKTKNKEIHKKIEEKHQDPLEVIKRKGIIVTIPANEKLGNQFIKEMLELKNKVYYQKEIQEEIQEER